MNKPMFALCYLMYLARVQLSGDRLGFSCWVDPMKGCGEGSLVVRSDGYFYGRTVRVSVHFCYRASKVGLVTEEVPSTTTGYASSGQARLHIRLFTTTCTTRL